MIVVGVSVLMKWIIKAGQEGLLNVITYARCIKHINDYGISLTKGLKKENTLRSFLQRIKQNQCVSNCFSDLAMKNLLV